MGYNTPSSSTLIASEIAENETQIFKDRMNELEKQVCTPERREAANGLLARPRATSTSMLNFSAWRKNSVITSLSMSFYTSTSRITGNSGKV